MISVCLATYNGAPYIERELRSILSQLSKDDEVILVDDHSSDATLDAVGRIGDGHTGVTLVLSDAKIINDADEVVAESYLESRGGFSSGIWHNIIKNKYLGCTMAFRRSMKDMFLPIPKDVPMHGVWIGCVNSIYGKPFLRNVSMMGYRRHQYNATPSKRRGIVQILVGRWRLVKRGPPSFGVLHPVDSLSGSRRW